MKKGRPTNDELLQGWKDGYAPDLARWRSLFAFLVEEHGFTSTDSVVPAACSLDFAKGDAHVTIQREYSDPPWITVRHGDVGFGLEQAMAAIDPSAHAASGDAIEQQARFVRAHLAALLAWAG